MMAIDSAGTETWFNNSFKIEIDPEKTEFLEKLNASETSSIFLVNYHGEPRVLKAVRAFKHTCIPLPPF